MRSNKNKTENILMILMSIVLTAAGICCMTVKLSVMNVKPGFDILAAEMAFPTGDTEYGNSEVTVSETPSETSTPEKSAVAADSSEISSKPESSTVNSKKEEKKNENSEDFEASEATEKEIEEYNKKHDGEEQYPVYEFTITEGNESYKSVQIKNTSSTDIDIKKELESKLGFEMEKTDEPQVLIYHTHTSESFLQ